MLLGFGFLYKFVMVFFFYYYYFFYFYFFSKAENNELKKTQLAKIIFI